mmetsp:Transcript_16778/g.23752  ORF Transcript_16778/g.23752 Transcript_16778/m.23752 type:complete len:175 (+) Transcript_16778:795-1319(+)
MKAHIIASINLEIKALRIATSKKICEIIRETVSIFHIVYGLKATFNHPICLSIISNYWEDFFLQISPDCTYNACHDLFIDIHNISTDLRQHPNGLPSTPSIVSTLKSLLHTSIFLYKSHDKKRDQALLLKKRAKEVLLLSKTDEATFQVESEQPFTPTQLASLVNAQVNAAVNR